MAKVPTIGKFNKPVQFERPAKPPDGVGGRDEMYESWFRCRAALERKSMERNLQDGYDQTVKRYKMWITWRQVIEGGMEKDLRVIYEARSFRIENAALVDEKRRIYEFDIIEVR